MRSISIMLVTWLAAGAALAAGIPSLSDEAYLERAQAAIDAGLTRGDRRHLDEFIELVETGAYHKEPRLESAMRRGVTRMLQARLADPERRHPRLALALDRLQKAPRAVPQRAPRPISLPADEAAHLRLAEWWYFNGHLEDETGRPFGYELTFFHVRPGIFFVHTAITDVEGKAFHRQRTYVSPGQCSASTSDLDVRYGTEHLLKRTGEWQYRIRSSTPDSSLDLKLRSTKSPMIVNGNGLIDMPEGTFSWYYSLTRVVTDGEISVAGKKFKVKGLSWFDHQWGNFVTLRVGWDWFSIQLEDGRDFNLFSFRPRGQAHPIAQYVNVLDARASISTANSMSIERHAFWKSPDTGNSYVTHYTVGLPGGEKLDVRARLDGQEMPAARFDPAPTYWEGKCDATTLGERPVKGLCYSEQFAFPRQ